MMSFILTVYKSRSRIINPYHQSVSSIRIIILYHHPVSSSSDGVDIEVADEADGEQELRDQEALDQVKSNRELLRVRVQALEDRVFHSHDIRGDLGKIIREKWKAIVNAGKLRELANYPVSSSVYIYSYPVSSSCINIHIPYQYSYLVSSSRINIHIPYHHPVSIFISRIIIPYLMSCLH